MIGDVVVGSDEVAVGSGDAYDLYMATVQFVELGALVLPVPGDTSPPYRPERPANATDVAVMQTARVGVLNAHARLCKVIVRHIAGSTSGRPDVGISPVASLRTVTGGVTQNLNNRTVGCAFTLSPGDPIFIRGIRFYWIQPGSVVAKLWHFSSITSLASQSVTVTGPGVYEAIFPTPYEVADPALYGLRFVVSAYNSAGYPSASKTGASAFFSALPTAPIIGHRMVWSEFNYYANGDGQPGAQDATNAFMCEPIF